MTCPRCASPTDRNFLRNSWPWSWREPLICTRCFADIEIRRVSGTLLILPPKEAICGRSRS